MLLCSSRIPCCLWSKSSLRYFKIILTKSRTVPLLRDCSNLNMLLALLLEIHLQNIFHTSFISLVQCISVVRRKKGSFAMQIFSFVVIRSNSECALSLLLTSCVFFLAFNKTFGILAWTGVVNSLQPWRLFQFLPTCIKSVSSMFDMSKMKKY